MDERLNLDLVLNLSHKTLLKKEKYIKESIKCWLFFHLIIICSFI